MRERETIYTKRRSIRRFESTPVETEKLTEILEAARWAPTWGNTQCCQIVVVQREEEKKELSETLSKKNSATLCVQKAPVVLAVCATLKRSGYYSGKALTKFGDWFMFDTGIIAQNICLSAFELDLGSVIVGAFDHDKVKGILKVPDDIEVVCLIPLGYPAHNPPAPPRRDLDEFVHQEVYEER
jgi:nitroreductase